MLFRLAKQSPKNYYKPKIEIRDYDLKWNNESYGISQKEIPELKRFATNAIPFFDQLDRHQLLP